MTIVLNDKAQISIPTHPFGVDREYDLKDAITPQVPAGTLSGRSGNQMWVITRPLVMPLVTEHIYPTHGQFADWEMGQDVPVYMQRDHPGND